VSKYPISIGGGKVSPFFDKILRLHFPKGSRILDPTCGKKLLWADIDQSEWEVTFSDIAPHQDSLTFDLFDLPSMEFGLQKGKFDGIIYDPPYFFGVPLSNDPRAEAYGFYRQSKGELRKFMEATVTVFPSILRPQGKLIVKCSDQYYVPEKKLYLLHYMWLTIMLRAYKIVDFYVYHYPRVSPTAYQVKNRGSSIIAHTYFIVGQIREGSQKDAVCSTKGQTTP